MRVLCQVVNIGIYNRLRLVCQGKSRDKDNGPLKEVGVKIGMAAMMNFSDLREDVLRSSGIYAWLKEFQITN